jgi:hypothetical protein
MPPKPVGSEIWNPVARFDDWCWCAGLGQLPSPKLTTAFSSSYPQDSFPEQRLGSNAAHELPPQQW